MPNRIDTVFAKLSSQNKKAFVAYITAGDPHLDATCEIAIELDKVGVDVLELGVPFSDPLADGTVNQLAAQRALNAGTTLHGVLEMVKYLRETSQIPIVLFTYLNPVYTYGFDTFYRDAKAAGVDGVLLLDLPPEEAEYHSELQNHHTLANICLIAPTTPDSRIQRIVKNASGFIYYVSREGVTGTQDSVAQGIAEHITSIRKSTNLPIAIGFGISNPEQVKATAQYAEGVIVGSAIVKQIASLGSDPAIAKKIADFVRPLADATK